MGSEMCIRDRHEGVGALGSALFNVGACKKVGFARCIGCSGERVRVRDFRIGPQPEANRPPEGTNENEKNDRAGKAKAALSRHALSARRARGRWVHRWELMLRVLPWVARWLRTQTHRSRPGSIAYSWHLTRRRFGGGLAVRARFSWTRRGWPRQRSRRPARAGARMAGPRATCAGVAREVTRHRVHLQSCVGAASRTMRAPTVHTDDNKTSDTEVE